MEEKFNHLSTVFEQELTDNPYNEHPRPQFRRESFISLNGWWNFCVQSKKGEIKANEKILVPSIKGGLCGCILTQVSDIEDETNGLLTYDRKVLKVNKEKIGKTSARIYDAFRSAVGKRKDF